VTGLCLPLTGPPLWIPLVLLVLGLNVSCLSFYRPLAKKAHLRIEKLGISIDLNGQAVILLIGLVIMLLASGSWATGHRFLPGVFGCSQKSHAYKIPEGTSLSLREIREQVQEGSVTTIVLAPAIEEVKVTGEFSGACAAELMHDICERYPNKLDCNATWDNAKFMVKPH